MKAVGVTGPDFMPSLFDIDEPIAAPDGVVVDVIAASVNDFDRAAVHGRYHGLTDQLDPVLLGRDFVGRVASVGDDVDYIDVGMYVAGAMAPQAAGQPGTFTEMVAVPATLLAPVPDGVDVAHVAGVGLAGVTALDAVNVLGATHLGTMVIHGPVSGVGGFALQLAKERGAVVAAVTVPEQADLARELGADVVIPEGANAIRSIQKVREVFGGGVDTAIHVAGDLAVAAGVVAPGWEVHLRHRHHNAGYVLRIRVCSDDRRPERAQASGSALQGRRAPSTQLCAPHPIFRPGRRGVQSAEHAP